MNKLENFTTILSKIYNGQIDFIDENPPIKTSKKELDLYAKLEQSLTEEQFEIFEEFLECYADRLSDYQEYTFKQGAKFGFNLVKELYEIKE